MTHRFAIGVVLTVSALVVAVTGCTTTDGTPIAAQSASSRTSTSATTSSTTTPSTTKTTSAAPTGPPIGTATLQVTGGTGPVTIRYQINGGPEQSETGVTLPWEKQYPVYDEVQSSVTADGGDTALICTIMMDGKLLSFVSEPRPTCSFAYYG